MSIKIYNKNNILQIDQNFTSCVLADKNNKLRIHGDGYYQPWINDDRKAVYKLFVSNSPYFSSYAIGPISKLHHSIVLEIDYEWGRIDYNLFISCENKDILDSINIYNFKNCVDSGKKNGLKVYNKFKNIIFDSNQKMFRPTHFVEKSIDITSIDVDNSAVFFTTNIHPALNCGYLKELNSEQPLTKNYYAGYSAYWYFEIKDDKLQVKRKFFKYIKSEDIKDLEEGGAIKGWELHYESNMETLTGVGENGTNFADYIPFMIIDTKNL